MTSPVITGMNRDGADCVWIMGNGFSEWASGPGATRFCQGERETVFSERHFKDRFFLKALLTDDEERVLKHAAFMRSHARVAGHIKKGREFKVPVPNLAGYILFIQVCLYGAR